MASLEALAATISEQVARLSALHQELGTPPPTLDKAGSRDYATEADTPTGESLRQTRSQILDAAMDLIRLVRGPTEHVLTLTWSVSSVFPLHCAPNLAAPFQSRPPLPSLRPPAPDSPSAGLDTHFSGLQTLRSLSKVPSGTESKRPNT